MGNLADKFKSMGINLGTTKPARPLDQTEAVGEEADKTGQGALLYPRPDLKPISIDQVVAGSYHSTIYGDIFAVETLYPPDFSHGRTKLVGLNSIKMVSQYARATQLASSRPGSFVFLDTETSGLAGGTGTFAFLVGVGRHTDQGFSLVQFFMRTPGEEAALLAALSEWMEPLDAIVTYNGKAFDAPILNTRYILQGMTSPIHGLPHIDLLPLARRLWRDRLPSRTLKSVEYDILGASRTEEEVPGWMVPELYFNYLKNGDARPLGGVFYHNAVDVISLAALFSHTSSLLDDPLAHYDQPGLDLVSMAKLYEDMGHLDLAVQLYEVGMERGLPEDFFWKTVERYSFLHKRQKEWPTAIALWQKAAGHGEMYAFIELAKYYEHELRDPSQAVDWAQKGIDQIDRPGTPPYLRSQWRKELEHRLVRLKSKPR